MRHAYATTDGGAKWQIQSLPTVAFWLSSITCATTLNCVAVGIAPSGGPLLLTTVNGGARWTVPSLPDSAKSAYGIGGVACPTSMVCFAVSGGPDGGVIIGSTSGGKTWRAQTAPRGTNYYNGVSCSSSSTCTIVGGNLSETTPPALLTTTDGGTKWIARSSDSIVTGESLYGISCPSTKDASLQVGRTAEAGGSLGPLTQAVLGRDKHSLRVSLMSEGSPVSRRPMFCAGRGRNPCTIRSGEGSDDH